MPTTFPTPSTALSYEETRKKKASENLKRIQDSPYSQVTNLFKSFPSLYNYLSPLERQRLNTALNAYRQETEAGPQGKPFLQQLADKINPPLTSGMTEKQDYFNNTRMILSNKRQVEQFMSSEEGKQRLADLVKSDIDFFFIDHPHVTDPSGPYRTTQGYGENPQNYKQFGGHEGYDIAIPANEPIYAPIEGKVVLVDSNTAYGNRIRIINPKTNEMYDLGHLNGINVQPGQEFKKGQLLGLGGSTGRSTGNHLHINYLKDGKLTDPLKSDLVSSWVKGITGEKNVKEVVMPAQESTPSPIQTLAGVQDFDSQREQYRVQSDFILPKTPMAIQQKVKEVFGAEADKALTVLGTENPRLDANAYNFNDPNDPRVSPAFRGSGDYGMFQINNVTLQDFQNRFPDAVAKIGIRTIEDLRDVDKNVKMAKLIRDKQGWGAWKGWQNQGFDVTKSITPETTITQSPTAQLLPQQESIWQRISNPGKVYASDRTQSQNQSYQSSFSKIPTPSMATSYSQPILKSKPPPSSPGGGGGTSGGGGGAPSISRPSISVTSTPRTTVSAPVKTGGRYYPAPGPAPSKPSPFGGGKARGGKGASGGW